MLDIRDLTFRLGDRLLFDHASCALPPGGRIGFVGRNGSGKTTLFRMIAGELGAESGTIQLPSGVRIGRVEQEAPGGPQTLLDFVLAADTERAALLAEAEIAREPERIADIHLRLADISAQSAPARAGAILHGLGFDTAAQNRPCSDFSGGWRMRVALAATLFVEPDLLLLDEPTNYLDLEGTIWLQDHLTRYPHTMIAVSHDRDFIDTIATHTLHIDACKLVLYRGGYSQFERQRSEAARLAEKAAASVAAERARLTAFIERFRAKASKAAQAQSRARRLEKLADVSLFAGEQAARLTIPDPEKPQAPPLVAFDRVAAGYGETIVLKRLSLSIGDEDRIGLIGANGNGKSTFVKLIAGRLAPLSGNIARSPKLNVAYFAQHQLEELDADATPYLLVRRRMEGQPEAKIRARAAAFGFSSDKSDTPITKLSGGEKARLLFGLATFDGPHLVILDEPTNHLDIPMRDALVEALAAYKGAAIIVSHDRHLIDATCDRLWLVDKGNVAPFDGDLSDYARLVMNARASSDDTPRERT
ncbi:MAG TPA: ABC-F family ATP-binding cassette domain-containing protein, partial [Beijerinckiaceae bacterium]|nr:ABC-F family ATP-binding cassette domain-containing protein [Beijerinckiaceae bacterium]